jgi:hypothetical protein
MQPPVGGQKGGRTEALLAGFTAEVHMRLGQLTGQHVLFRQGVVALLGKQKASNEGLQNKNIKNKEKITKNLAIINHDLQSFRPIPGNVCFALIITTGITLSYLN